MYVCVALTFQEYRSLQECLALPYVGFEPSMPLAFKRGDRFGFPVLAYLPLTLEAYGEQYDDIV